MRLTFFRSCFFDCFSTPIPNRSFSSLSAFRLSTEDGFTEKTLPGTFILFVLQLGRVSSLCRFLRSIFTVKVYSHFENSFIQRRGFRENNRLVFSSYSCIDVVWTLILLFREVYTVAVTEYRTMIYVQVDAIYPNIPVRTFKNQM